MKHLLPTTLGLVTLGSLLVAAETPPQRTELRAHRTELVTVGNETTAVCTRGPAAQVTLTGTNLKITCDRLEIVALGVGDKSSVAPTLEKFKYLLATGNVVIVQGDREARCGRAEVLPLENKIVLTENPRVIDRGSDWEDGGPDARITMFRDQRRVVVENGVLSGPSLKDLGFDKSAPPPAGTPTDPAQKSPPAK
jgi:lipopolysaccharide export system protein LptA